MCVAVSKTKKNTFLRVFIIKPSTFSHVCQLATMPAAPSLAKSDFETFPDTRGRKQAACSHVTPLAVDQWKPFILAVTMKSSSAIN